MYSVELNTAMRKQFQHFDLKGYPMMKISIVVLTKNEESNIVRCLKSTLPLSGEIIVVDSLSEDRTVEITKSFTDKIYLNPWPGFAKQREFALTKASHEWILWLDADEDLSQELVLEIQNLDFGKDGYYIPRLVHYLGRWIKHCGWYPDYTLRLFKKNKGSFTDVLVHEAFDLKGETGKLKNPIFHYPYRDIAHHIEKMNVYTTLASQQMHQKGKRASIFSILSHSFFDFIKMYVIRLGFLDGSQGLINSILGSYYVFLKYIKLHEMQGRNVPDGKL
jgi:glycosyltransferase involved in cell wall biosynthesis